MVDLDNVSPKGFSTLGRVCSGKMTRYQKFHLVRLNKFHFVVIFHRIVYRFNKSYHSHFINFNYYKLSSVLFVLYSSVLKYTIFYL